MTFIHMYPDHCEHSLELGTFVKMNVHSSLAQCWNPINISNARNAFVVGFCEFDDEKKPTTIAIAHIHLPLIAIRNMLENPFVK